MATGDCVKCWNTPCTCGYDYRHMTRDERIKLAAVILGVNQEMIIKCMIDVIHKEHPMKELNT